MHQILHTSCRKCNRGKLIANRKFKSCYFQIEYAYLGKIYSIFVNILYMLFYMNFARNYFFLHIEVLLIFLCCIFYKMQIYIPRDFTFSIAVVGVKPIIHFFNRREITPIKQDGLTNVISFVSLCTNRICFSTLKGNNSYTNMTTYLKFNLSKTIHFLKRP
jgi:hypothetical protein